MSEIASFKVLFIAGFGPIVGDKVSSKQLYVDTLGIAFKEEAGDYLHTSALNGAKSFALWPLEQAAQSCFGKDSWPEDLAVPQAWLELDVDNVRESNRRVGRSRAPNAGQEQKRAVGPDCVPIHFAGGTIDRH